MRIAFGRGSIFPAKCLPTTGNFVKCNLRLGRGLRGYRQRIRSQFS